MLMRRLLSALLGLLPLLAGAQTTDPSTGAISYGTVQGGPGFPPLFCVNTQPANGQALIYNSTLLCWANAAVAGASGGTVTSVAESDASTTPIYVITGSPVTSSGTLTQTLTDPSCACHFRRADLGWSYPADFSCVGGERYPGSPFRVYMGFGRRGHFGCGLRLPAGSLGCKIFCCEENLTRRHRRVVRRSPRWAG